MKKSQLCNSKCLKMFPKNFKISMFMVIVSSFWVQNSTGLTTFGKSQPSHPPYTPSPPVVRGRECRTEGDCAGIQNTSCIADQLDQKLRCLCEDGKAPMNGQCENNMNGAACMIFTERIIPISALAFLIILKFVLLQ